ETMYITPPVNVGIAADMTEFLNAVFLSFPCHTLLQYTHNPDTTPNGKAAVAPVKKSPPADQTNFSPKLTSLYTILPLESLTTFPLSSRTVIFVCLSKIDFVAIWE